MELLNIDSPLVILIRLQLHAKATKAIKADFKSGIFFEKIREIFFLLLESVQVSHDKFGRLWNITLGSPFLK